MGKQLSITANSSYLMIGKLIQRILSFFIVIFIARYLGPEKYGVATYVISFITLVAIFWNFGINTLVTRSVSRDVAIQKQYLGGGILAKSLLFFICFPFMAIYFYFAESREVLFSALIFAAGTFLGNICGVFNSMFIARRRMDYSALIQVVRSVALLIGVYAVSFSIVSLPRIFGCYFVSFLVTLVVVVALAARFFVLPQFYLERHFVLQLIRKSTPFFLISGVNIFLFRIDHVMISKIVGDVELGLYGAAYTIFEVVISFFPMIFMSSAFPVLSRLYANDFAALSDIYKLMFKYFLWLSLPMSLGLAVLAREICLTMYGQDYLQAGNMLLMLASGVWIFFMSTLVSWTLTACERQNMVLCSNVIAMVANIMLNFIFIPQYGGIGAASVTLMCELFNFVFMCIVLHKVMLKPSLGVGYYVRIMISLIVMGVPLLFFVFMSGVHGPLLLVGGVILGAVLYGMSSLLLKTVSFAELKILKLY
ncbi:MAG: flippase [Desulfobacula sp.]|jgi:O-antigen/teichoic acid export membrane protein|uniref:flippase n=1 Tax=Desulfobacula sp. TaxID=2593537 RepID=UPI001E186FF6|nr:flippase [Desulfobacula sp.]MBT4026456.1 flippase [Desulfobacula sp.]MBT4200315.1 flippase [Desulfobacula sp.]MBT4508460.1 flippase [Desulfobacula sp.]MBT4874640.1 flippase [Desulfobacula sp.]